MLTTVSVQQAKREASEAAVKPAPTKRARVSDDTASLKPSPFFKELQFKGNEIPLRDPWVTNETFETMANVGPAPPGTKIAGFDFDQCLVKESGFAGQIGATPKFASTIPKLKELHANGYKVVIFTNETIARLKNPDAVTRKLEVKMGRCESFVKACGFPIPVFAGIGGNTKNPSYYRKPNVGMWEFHETFCNGGVAIDMAESFFVGDAAGRKRDHGDADKVFAENVGIKFYTETDYFKSP